ncbi:MAG TPA: hypothetical protein VGD80_08025 [Kofleriaceae bacterium]
MIPFDVELGPDGGYRCRAHKPHTLTAMWLQDDLGRDGGGAIEEFFAELRELRDGRRDVAMTGGDAVHIVVDRSGATLGFFQLSERQDTDDLIDAVLRWFDVTHPELALQLRVLGGLDPDRGRPEQLLARHAVWHAAPDAEHPYETRFAGQRWQVRLNDFPAEVLYSLLIDGREVARFNDWPAAWLKPDAGPPSLAALPPRHDPPELRVLMLLAGILHHEVPRLELIEQALGTPLPRGADRGPIQCFTGQMREPPFRDVELQIHPTGEHTLLLFPAPGLLLRERDLGFEVITREPPSLDVNVNIPPEGVKTFVYRQPAADVHVRFTLRTKHLLYVAVHWKRAAR